MPIEYRLLGVDELDKAIASWMDTWDDVNPERTRRGITADPLYHERTFVAADESGTILSTVHYWLKYIRDEKGNPRLVGCVSHVGTRSSARRQGHARKLMLMALDDMRQKGCAWTLLFSTEMGQPVYEALGYRHYATPFYQGLLSLGRSAGSAGYSVRRYDPLNEPGGWEPVTRIYAAYNEQRPLSVVREDDYWQGIVAYKFEFGISNYETALFLATPEGDEEPCAYILVHFSTADFARQEANLDQLITVRELALLPGHESALDALLSAIADSVGPGAVGGRAYLPVEGPSGEAINKLFTGTPQQLDDQNAMALPLDPAFTWDDLDAAFNAPGAYFWQLDEF